MRKFENFRRIADGNRKEVDYCQGQGRPRVGGSCPVFIGSNLSAHVICSNHQGFYFNNFLVILNIILHDIRDHYSGAFFQNFLFVGILDCFSVGLFLIMLL